MDSPLDWEVDVTDSTLLYSLAYVLPSILGGILVLAVALLGWLVATALQAGNFVQAVSFIVVGLLSLFIRRYLPALRTTTLFDTFQQRYSRRGVVISSVLGALVLFASTLLHPVAPFVVFVASWIPVILTAGFPTTGHVDLESQTLVVDDTEIPLAALTGIRTVSIDTFVVCWLSYSQGVPSAPRVVVLPGHVFPPISRLLDRSLASASTDQEQSIISWEERMTAIIFGLGLIVLGPILWLALPADDGKAIALYAGAMFGLFGAMLLWYAKTA